MINIFILTVVTLGLSCTKNDSISPDDGNLINDSTNTLCMYSNIILDTSRMHSIDQNEIIKKWELIAYADLTDCSFITKPDSINKTVEINFLDLENIRGITLGNSFEGKYKMENDSINFIDIRMTLVQEPEWGDKLLNAINYTDLVTIKSDTLVIYYSQSKKAMIFFSKHKN